jgi:hypothetical protein
MTQNPKEEKELAQPKESSELAQPAKIEVTEDNTQSEAHAKLWKARYRAAKDYWKDHQWTKDCNRIRECLEGKFYEENSDESRVYVNQFLLSLKAKIPSVVYREPELDFEPYNDQVYEYEQDDEGNLTKDEDGEFIRKVGDDGKEIVHDMNDVAETLAVLILSLIHI